MTEEPMRKRMKKEKIDNDYIHENGMDILDKFDTSPEDSEQENGSGDPEYIPNGKPFAGYLELSLTIKTVFSIR
jgi:hypothetical protein